MSTTPEATIAPIDIASIDADPANIVGIAASIRGDSVAEVTAAYDIAVAQATGQGKKAPSVPHRVALRAAADAALARLMQSPPAPPKEPAAGTRVPAEPAPAGFHMVELRTEKLAGLVAPLLKGTASKVAAGNALHVKDANAAKVIAALVEAHSAATAQFDRRLLLVTIVALRAAYPEVSVLSTLTVHRLVDALHASPEVTGWSVGRASDGTLIWTVNGTEGKTTDFAKVYVPTAEPAPKPAKAAKVKVDPEPAPVG